MTTDRILRTLADLKPGDHLGFVYQTEAEYQALLTPFFRQGLERGEKILYISDAHPIETILDNLRDDGLEVEPYLDRGQLRLMTPGESYLRTGLFNPDDMLALWQKETERALVEGYRALRGAAEMSGALQGPAGSERLLEYESKLSSFLPDSNCLLICLYHGSGLDAEMLFNVLATHPAISTGPEIYDNPCCLALGDVVQGSLPLAVLGHWLETLAERRQIEAAVRKSEERYHSLVEISPDAIALTDLNVTITLVNQQVIRLFGFEYAEEMVGKSAFDLISPEEWPRAIENIQETLETGEIRNIEYTLLKKDGTPFPAELSASLIRDPEGKPKAFTAVLRDITERKQAESALRESEERLRRYFELGLMGMAVTSPNKGWLEVNDEICRILGYKREELFQTTWAEITHPDDIGLDIVQFDRLLAGEIDGYSLDKRFIRKDGQIVYTTISIKCLRQPDGSVDQLLGLLQDITERKQAEKMLLHSIQEMELAYQQSVVYARELRAEITERRRAEGEVRQYAARMETLAEISQAVAEAGLDVQAVLDTIARQTAEVIGDTCVITLLSHDEQWFEPVAFHHANSEVKALIESLFITTSASARNEWLAPVFQTGQPLFIPVVSQEQMRQSAQPEYLPFVEQVGMHSLLIVPLRVQGRVLGTLGLSRDKPGKPYTLDDKVFLQSLADRATLTIQNARLFEQAQGAHARLQALSLRLLEVQEAERRHIARELHDEISQTLTGLKLILNMSGRLPPEEARASLAEARALLNELMDMVDQLSLNLRPPMLDDLGLLPTLLWHFERYTQQTSIKVIFQHLGLEGRRFAPEVETTVYRLVQEALTNVARYAEVNEVRVQVWTRRETLFLQVEDEGRGFDPQAALAANVSSGLAGMHERAMLLGGHLVIESVPGAGTSLIAELPLPDKETR